MVSNRQQSARIMAALATILLVAACAGASPGSGSTSASATLPAPTPVGSGAAAEDYWLRLTTSQAIPPLDRFEVLPSLWITGDGHAVVPLVLPTPYPGPLVQGLSGRTVSDAGRAAIVQEARDLGLLGGQTDFSSDAPLPGGVVGQIELVVDGTRVTLTGDPSAHIECVTAPCDPPPGSAAAFGAFWNQLLDLPSWLGSDLGPPMPYDPPAYALVVGPPPDPEPPLSPPPADWPLDQPLASFGARVANGTARCGTVSGADADALRPALDAANQLTPWVQDPETSATFGLTVRPMVSGEDACKESFGVG
ncbi:MAG TPA: hypothetical protein VIZ22_11460 [Candidatus Limnocylindrales bacterium]